MSVPENTDRDGELAQLLAEVRALRRELDALKADASTQRPASRPTYEVLVNHGPIGRRSTRFS
jgi:hypothetical protein